MNENKNEFGDWSLVAEVTGEHNGRTTSLDTAGYDYEEEVGLCTA